MGAFYVPTGLQQSAAFLAMDAPNPLARPLLDVTVDSTVHLSGLSRPYRIVRLQEMLDAVLDGQADGTALADEIALLSQRLQAVLQRYPQDKPSPMADGYQRAADAALRMGIALDAGDGASLQIAFADLESAEQGIQRLVITN